MDAASQEDISMRFTTSTQQEATRGPTGMQVTITTLPSPSPRSLEIFPTLIIFLSVLPSAGTSQSIIGLTRGSVAALSISIVQGILLIFGATRIVLPTTAVAQTHQQDVVQQAAAVGSTILAHSCSQAE